MIRQEGREGWKEREKGTEVLLFWGKVREKRRGGGVEEDRTWKSTPSLSIETG